MEKSVMAKLFVFSFCAIALVSSLTAKAANFELPLKGGEKLSVNVPQANLQITANPNLKSIKVQMNPAATAEYGVYSDSGVIEPVPHEPR